MRALATTLSCARSITVTTVLSSVERAAAPKPRIPIIGEAADFWARIGASAAILAQALAGHTLKREDPRATPGGNGTTGPFG